MAQDTKEYILQKAFKTFLINGYDSTSMTILQKEFAMSRGAMYRYFSGKEELFQAVVDKFFWGLINFLHPQYDKNITVIDLIDNKIKTLENVANRLKQAEEFETVILNYNAFVVQASKHYPGFIDKFRNHRNAEMKQWEFAIRNSINKGEVRQDIDVEIMAKIFAKTLDYNQSSATTENTLTATKQKKILTYIYSLIKT